MNAPGTRRGRSLALVEKLKGKGIQAPRLLAAIGQVPRHLFVEEALADQAYEDCSLPLGEKQTISQPSMVAFMLSLLAVQPTDRVLEIGTGSGYQTALLGHLAAQVYSIERIASLARPASQPAPENQPKSAPRRAGRSRQTSQDRPHHRRTPPRLPPKPYAPHFEAPHRCARSASPYRPHPPRP